MASSYKYAVRLRGKVVAYTTTKREAEQEARSVGGTYGPIEKNPSDDEGDSLEDLLQEMFSRTATSRRGQNVLLARLGEEEPAFDSPSAESRMAASFAAHSARKAADQGGVREMARAQGERPSAYLERDCTRYLFTLLAPKSMVPVAFYASDTGSTQVGFTPDRSRALTRNPIDYRDTETIGGRLYVRTHMAPGVMNQKEDLEKGLGAIAYIASSLGTADPNPGKATQEEIDGVWSMAGDRTEDASKAWESLHRHGVSEHHSKERSDTTVVSLRQNLKADEVAKATRGLKGGSRLRIEGTTPAMATVSISGEVVLDTIDAAHAASLGFILSVSPAIEPHLRNSIASPPFAVFTYMDLSYVTESAFLEFVTQCVGEDEFPDDWRMVQSFTEDNPTYQGSVLQEEVGDDLGALGMKWRSLPRKNPRHRPKRVSERQFNRLMAGDWD